MYLKVRLTVSEERFVEIQNQLNELGIEVDDEADLVLSEANRFLDSLIVKDFASDEKIVLAVKDISYIETYGHLVEVHTRDSVYKSTERLYKILQQLDNSEFIRISNSVAISRNHVKKIKPTLSMKFVLTMTDDKTVDVTRSYYYMFKEFFNI